MEFVSIRILLLKIDEYFNNSFIFQVTSEQWIIPIAKYSLPTMLNHFRCCPQFLRFCQTRCGKLVISREPFVGFSIFLAQNEVPSGSALKSRTKFGNFCEFAKLAVENCSYLANRSSDFRFS